MSEKIRMTYEEWLAKGKELFGEDMLQWKFVCPNCGHVQCAEDFRKYVPNGAKPDDAHFNCIGRYKGGNVGTLGDGKSPCNYTAGGLFRLSPIIVEMEGKEVFSFAFAEGDQDG